MPRQAGSCLSCQTLGGMTHAIASPKLIGVVAALSGAAMLPFVWAHLVGSSADHLAWRQAAHLQLEADLLLPIAERAVLVLWMLLPVLWALVAIGYLRSGPVGPTRGKAILLFLAALGAGALSTGCYGAATAPLFMSSPVLGFLLATRLRATG